MSPQMFRNGDLKPREIERYPIELRIFVACGTPADILNKGKQGKLYSHYHSLVC
jgi:hypothetical protein